MYYCICAHQWISRSVLGRFWIPSQARCTNLRTTCGVACSREVTPIERARVAPGAISRRRAEGAHRPPRADAHRWPDGRTQTDRRPRSLARAPCTSSARRAIALRPRPYRARICAEQLRIYLYLSQRARRSAARGCALDALGRRTHAPRSPALAAAPTRAGGSHRARRDRRSRMRKMAKEESEYDRSQWLSARWDGVWVGGRARRRGGERRTRGSMARKKTTFGEHQGRAGAARNPQCSLMREYRKVLKQRMTSVLKQTRHRPHASKRSAQSALWGTVTSKTQWKSRS